MYIRNLEEFVTFAGEPGYAVKLYLSNLSEADIRYLRSLYRRRDTYRCAANLLRLRNDDVSTLNISNTSDIRVTKVIYHNPATIVFWSDGTKTVVKCDKNDTYDPAKGFYIACAKRLFGNNYAAVGRINKALEMAEVKNER